MQQPFYKLYMADPSRPRASCDYVQHYTAWVTQLISASRLTHPRSRLILFLKLTHGTCQQAKLSPQRTADVNRSLTEALTQTIGKNGAYQMEPNAMRPADS